MLSATNKVIETNKDDIVEKVNMNNKKKYLLNCKI